MKLVERIFPLAPYPDIPTPTASERPTLGAAASAVPVEITPAGLAWLSLENENACLRNELAVVREHADRLELEKHNLNLRLAEAVEANAIDGLELRLLRRWLADKAKAGA